MMKITKQNKYILNESMKIMKTQSMPEIFYQKMSTLCKFVERKTIFFYLITQKIRKEM